MNNDNINELYSKVIEAIWDLYKNDEDIYRFFKSFELSQYKSKKQVVDILVNNGKQYNNICILGAWYGTWLPILLTQVYPTSKITCIDSDRSLKELTKRFHKLISLNIEFKYTNALSFLKSDEMLNYDLVINPSCEHMPDMKDFLIYKHCDYILQSNNHYTCEEHTNCKDSIDNFIPSTGLNNIKFQHITKLDKFDRFTVFGNL